MTKAKIVLILCKLQDYYHSLSGKKGTKKTIAIRDVLSVMAEYVAEPKAECRKWVEYYFKSFLNIFAEVEEKIFQRETPRPMEIYRHFKGNRYVVINGEAVNCTNGTDADEKFVVYFEYGKTSKIYIRKQSEFLSPVDKEKYPDAKQEWRFEKVGGEHK